MILLLDANALLWWLADDPTLSPRVRSAIADPTNDVLVSAASVWEIEIKRAIGKLRAPDGVVAAIESAGFLALPITLGDAEQAGRLPPHHRDPFDRMLIAQANRLDAIIATRDTAFAAYGVDTRQPDAALDARDGFLWYGHYPYTEHRMAIERATSRKEDRLELRLERERRQLIDQAAQATGLSTSAFVLEHATLAAQQALTDRTLFVLPADRWDAFVELLDRPVQPVEGLAAFLARRSILEPE